jgi:hypothetical protein
VTGDTSLTGPLTIKSYDGYIYPTYTPVYASSTSITVAGTDVTAQFPVGTKIVLNQSGLKYFYVTSRSFSTDTTINLTGGSDYTVANAAISGFGYSYDAAPQGFPQWFSYTVAFTNITEGNGTDASYFKMNGNEVVYRIHFTFGSTTSVAGNVGASLPVTASSTGWSSATYAGKGILKDSGTAEYNATLEVSSTTVCSVYVDLVSGSYIIKAQLSSTIPFSWTTNDVISGVVIYRAA